MFKQPVILIWQDEAMGRLVAYADRNTPRWNMLVLLIRRAVIDDGRDMVETRDVMAAIEQHEAQAVSAYAIARGGGSPARPQGWRGVHTVTILEEVPFNALLTSRYVACQAIDRDDYTPKVYRETRKSGDHDGHLFGEAFQHAEAENPWTVDESWGPEEYGNFAEARIAAETFANDEIAEWLANQGDDMMIGQR